MIQLLKQGVIPQAEYETQEDFDEETVQLVKFSDIC